MSRAERTMVWEAGQRRTSGEQHGWWRDAAWSLLLAGAALLLLLDPGRPQQGDLTISIASMVLLLAAAAIAGFCSRSSAGAPSSGRQPEPAAGPVPAAHAAALEVIRPSESRQPSLAIPPRRSDPLLAALQESRSTMQDLQDHSRQLETRLHSLFLNTVRMLVAAIDAKDDYTGGHSERVAYYSWVIGERLGLTEEELQLLELGALLHDVGKIGVPDAVLNKAGSLSGEEIEVIRRHAELSGRILSQAPELDALRRIAVQHHERWDGTGYPAGLAGEEICQAARIVAVADCWDAMISDRIYRPGMSPEQALEKMLLLGGRQLDPAIVALLPELFSQLRYPIELGAAPARRRPAEHRPRPRVSSAPVRPTPASGEQRKRAWLRFRFFA